MQVRMSRADLALAGGRLVIPRGTLVLVPHHAIQNSAHTWDRPDKFLPGARGPLPCSPCM
jgi:cytochrome P450